MPKASCPGCGGAIPFEMHEINLVVECASCACRFTPLGGVVTTSRTPERAAIAHNLDPTDAPEKNASSPVLGEPWLRNKRPATWRKAVLIVLAILLVPPFLFWIWVEVWANVTVPAMQQIHRRENDTRPFQDKIREARERLRNSSDNETPP